MRRYVIAIAIAASVLGAGLTHLWAENAESKSVPKVEQDNIQPRSVSTQGNARWIHYLVHTLNDLGGASQGEAPLGAGLELDMTRFQVTAAPGTSNSPDGTISIIAADGGTVALVYLDNFGTQQFSFDPPIPIRPGYKIRFLPTQGVPSYGNWMLVLSGYVPGMPRNASGVLVQ